MIRTVKKVPTRDGAKFLLLWTNASGAWAGSFKFLDGKYYRYMGSKWEIHPLGDILGQSNHTIIEHDLGI